MSASTTYTSRLSKTQIRLLHLLPDTDPSAVLNCAVLDYELDETPLYEALSYVWGAPTPTRDILVNGENFSIGQNLHDALSRLRQSDEDSVRVLWTDAICINQKDIEEKNVQVPLMGHIYSNAEQVVVWMGPVADDIAFAAAASLTLISKACRAVTDGKSYVYTDYKDVKIPQEEYDTIAWDALHQLFSQRWFRRIWCVQEVRLAKQAKVLWGDSCEFEGQDIGIAATWTLYRLDITQEEAMVRPSLIQVATAGRAHIVYTGATVNATFYDLLFSFQQWEATDARDKVYGLLNLFAEKEIVELLGVDYGKPVAEVMADTVLAVIKGWGNLTGLSYVVHPMYYEGSRDYNSWTPRWDDKTPASPFNYPGGVVEMNASKGLGVQVVNIEESLLHGLRLKGLRVDYVTYVTECMRNNYFRNDEGYIHPFLALWSSYFSMKTNVKPEERNEIIRSMARTCSGGHRFLPLSEASDTTFYEGYMASLAESMRQCSEDEWDSEHDRYILSMSDRGKAETYDSGVATKCHNRRLFMLQDGKFGLGPACMREQDIVVVLFGGDTPYALRHWGEENHYALMGEVYIDGLMGGKMVDDMHAGKIQEEEFCLV
jgi:hypothetical protein